MRSSLQFWVEEEVWPSGEDFPYCVKSGEDTEEIVNSILVKLKSSD